MVTRGNTYSDTELSSWNYRPYLVHTFKRDIELAAMFFSNSGDYHDYEEGLSSFRISRRTSCFQQSQYLIIVCVYRHFQSHGCCKDSSCDGRLGFGHKLAAR